MKKYYDDDEIKIGLSASIKTKITDILINEFAEVTGDKNPIHLYDSYAEKTIFKKRIAHGMLLSSFISSVLANNLPGPGTIYLEQSLNFKLPVYIGDTITTEVKVIDKITEKNIIILNTKCYNQKNNIVISGKAKVMFKLAFRANK